MRRITHTVVSLSFAACLVVAASGPAAEENKTWKPLMDGKTLAGWHPVGLGKWTVEDGVMLKEIEIAD